jgi:hypothetical protein
MLGFENNIGGNQLSFPSPTQTQVFDNRSNGYNDLSTSHMRRSAGH